MIKNYIEYPFGKEQIQGVDGDLNNIYATPLATFEYKEREYILVGFDDDFIGIGYLQKADNEERTYVFQPIMNEQHYQDVFDILEKNNLLNF